MGAYLVRRILYVIPTLFIMTIICFLVITLPPGDYLTSLRAQLAEGGVNDSSLARQAERLENRYGLGKPIHVQYGIWFSGLLRGDFGESFELGEPVKTVIGDRLLFTLVVAISTLIFTWVVALPIGIYSATHQYSLGDYFTSFIGFLGLSIPNFLLAFLFMFISVFYFDATSIGGLFSRGFQDAPWSIPKVIDLLKHLWIPIIVIGTSGTASLIRMMRANLLDVMGEQYIQTARAKGLKERIVIYKHAVRVAINPLISVFGMQFPQILSGGMVTGIVLGLPTIGPLLYHGLTSRDTYLTGAILLFYGVALIVGNLLADILLAVSDPRIRYE